MEKNVLKEFLTELKIEGSINVTGKRIEIKECISELDGVFKIVRLDTDLFMVIRLKDNNIKVNELNDVFNSLSYFQQIEMPTIHSVAYLRNFVSNYNKTTEGKIHLKTSNGKLMAFKSLLDLKTKPKRGHIMMIEEDLENFIDNLDKPTEVKTVIEKTSPVEVVVEINTESLNEKIKDIILTEKQLISEDKHDSIILSKSAFNSEIDQRNPELTVLFKDGVYYIYSDVINELYEYYVSVSASKTVSVDFEPEDATDLTFMFEEE